MSSSENIRNAFHVVYQTYENIQKLMDYCKTISNDKSNYINVVDKFLRYKSDNDIAGWYIQDFIILFQNKNDAELDNEWREGPIYVMEIELYNSNVEFESMKDMPCVHLSKFEYKTIEEWDKGASPSEHWGFYYPLRDYDSMHIQEENGILHIKPLNEKASARYWEVEKVTSKRIPLVEITADNIVEKVFKTFDIL